MNRVTILLGMLLLGILVGWIPGTGEANTPEPTVTPTRRGGHSATLRVPKVDDAGPLLRPFESALQPPDGVVWDAAAPVRFYPATGHTLGLVFKTFYDAHGGEALFGAPITEVLVDDATGMYLQYYERFRLEYDPDDGTHISITRIGALAAADLQIHPAFAWQSDMTPDTETFHATETEPNEGDELVFFPESGHTLSGTFRTVWEENGGVPILGYPISEPFPVQVQVQTTIPRMRTRAGLDSPTRAITSTAITTITTTTVITPTLSITPTVAITPTNGEAARLRSTTVTAQHLRRTTTETWQVQYFERTRLAYRLDASKTSPVMEMASLGRWLAAAHHLNADLLAAAPPVVALGSGTLTFADSPGTANAILAAQRLNGHVVQPGQAFSFLDTVGELSMRTGYTSGAAIVGGQVVPVVAGGICQTSTALYRAAFLAGLPILERQNHTLYLDGFNDILSFDAAVFSPDLDLRFRNDTPHPILVAATGKSGTVTVTLWGQGDGRQVERTNPVITAQGDTPATRWQYDPNLAPDATVQQISPRPGMEVVLGRIVRDAAGTVQAHDQIVSRYEAIAGLMAYGAAVIPPVDAVVVGDLPPTPTVTPTDAPTDAPTATPDVAPDQADMPMATPTLVAGDPPPESTESDPPSDPPTDPTPPAAPTPRTLVGSSGDL